MATFTMFAAYAKTACCSTAGRHGWRLAVLSKTVVQYLSAHALKARTRWKARFLEFPVNARKCKLTPSMQRVARNVRVNNYTSASMVCITLDGIYVTHRGFCTLCLI